MSDDSPTMVRFGDASSLPEACWLASTLRADTAEQGGFSALVSEARAWKEYAETHGLTHEQMSAVRRTRFLAPFAPLRIRDMLGMALTVSLAGYVIGFLILSVASWLFRWAR